MESASRWLMRARGHVLGPAHLPALEAVPDPDLVPGLALVHGQDAVAPNLARVRDRGLARPDESLGRALDHALSPDHAPNQDLAPDHLKNPSLDHVLHRIHRETIKKDLQNLKAKKISTKMQLM